MHRSIIGFHQDLEQHWVAELDCGHCQHTRHEPPFFPRPWVISEAGRLEHLGVILPEVEHEVEPIDEVEFFVEFWSKV